jgi:hypothetical protein
MARALRARNATCYREDDEDSIQDFGEALSMQAGPKQMTLLTTRQPLQRGMKPDRQQQGSTRDQMKDSKQPDGKIRPAKHKATSSRCGVGFTAPRFCQDEGLVAEISAGKLRLCVAHMG